MAKYNYYFSSLSLLSSDPPNVDVSPKSFVLNQTQPVNFTCTAYGIPPPTLTWYDTRNLSEPLRPTRALNIIEDTYYNDTGFSLVESVLFFTSALRTDASGYTCVASNDILNLLDTPETGSTVLYVQGELACPPLSLPLSLSSITHIFLYLFIVPVLVTSSPPERVDHFRGGTINISCTATGLPLPTVTWHKNGNVLELNNRIFIDEVNETTPTSGLITSTLIFEVLELSDNGSYYCVANNTGAPGNEFVEYSEDSFLFITRK